MAEYGMSKEMTDEQVRTVARKMAREMGDTAWKAGNTKGALEAYEASDMTPRELFGLVEKLREAVQLVTEHKGLFDQLASQHPSHTANHSDFRARIHYWSDLAARHASTCAVCSVAVALRKSYFPRVAEVLGWEWNGEGDFISTAHEGPEFYQGAILACLKLIKRI